MQNSTFDLVRLIQTVFRPQPGERLGIFIDLPDPHAVRDWQYLQAQGPPLVTQRLAHDVFYCGLLENQAKLPFAGIEFYAYEPTGGSNLELPPAAVNTQGKTLRLVDDVLAHLNIVLYLSTFSATAPLTALAKRMGFRGATMHGCNETILRTGLAQDYERVSAKAERLRRAVTGADSATLEFETAGQRHQLNLDLARQEAQKSHGLCRTPGEIANLPAGEIYWVPTGAEGRFPLKFKADATLGLMEVAEGRIRHGTLLRGNAATLSQALDRFQTDPATSQLGELGLGTQVLPVAGADIQDEKILGTVHVATGRDDHLGGRIDATRFKDRRNATHEDILFAPHTTPEVRLAGVWLLKDGRRELLLKDYEPTDFVKQLAV